MFRTIETDELIRFSEDLHEMGFVCEDDEEDAYYEAKHLGAYALDEKGYYNGTLIYITLKEEEFICPVCGGRGGAIGDGTEFPCHSSNFEGK